MKTRVRKYSDSEWVESLPDISTLPTSKTARSLSRQVCIGDLEEKLHKAFANARLRGGTDFVYERDCNAYALLDDFCNWNQMSEPACPLVVSGCSGSGKSALLANWLFHYRQRLEHRLRNGGTREEPFVFCHAVGCTRHSVDVEQLLWRLLADLKQHFNLTRNVPSEAARLSWELPGFLELAARKGLVIIIIDGLHRLQDKNEGETGLQWLPLQVPANVRIIVTATLPGPNYLQLQEQKLRRVASNPHQKEPSPLSESQSRGGDEDDACTSPIPRRSTTDIEGIDGKENTSNHHRRKVLMELSRRSWPVLEVGPLEDWRKRDIVEAFLRRSIVGRRSSSGEEAPASDTTWSSKMTRRTPTFLTGVIFEDDTASEDTLKPGLVLFPSMVERILSRRECKATNSALYLRTLLRVLEWAAMNSYDVHALLDTILATASSVRALYNVIFDCIEAGNQPTDASIAAARAANEADGGLPALQLTVGSIVRVGSTDRRIPQHDQHHREQNQRSSHQTESVTDEKLTIEAPSQAGHENKKQVEQEEADKGKMDGAGAGKEDKEGDHKMGDEYSEDHYEDDFEEEDECGRNTRRGEEARRDISHDDQKVLRGHMDADSSADRDTLMVESSSIFNDRKEGREEGSAADIQKEADMVSVHDITSGVVGKATAIAVGGSGQVNTLSEIPVYLSGGKKVDGLGVTIGRAMALLHVVRHGLWSEELWAILVALRTSTSAQERAEGTERQAESRLVRKLLKNQKRLIDTIRVMDANRDGVISIEEFRSAVVSMGLGLTEQQVKKLIRSIDTDQNGELDVEEMLERFSQTARKMKRDIASGSRLRKDSANEGALSDEIKQSLTSVLSVLGVIHDDVKHKGEMHRIFVLGLDAEDLREVVFRRYVSYTSTWHTRLVRFFQALPPSLRRCEELPWHLKKCYKWYPLKDTLVDLRTFETMWTKTQLKRELMDYWTILTEGPLYAREKMEKGNLRNNRNLLSVMSQDSSSREGVAGSVSSADTTAMSNGSHSASAGKVAPFDIVFEYNHAIEGWQALSRPTISRLGGMVHAVGDFMREMSHLVQKEYASPPFLHMHLAYEDLTGVGIPPELVVLAGVNSSPESQGGSLEEERPSNKDTILAKPKDALRVNLSQYRVAPFYYFQRWLWIQFPWMALSSISGDPRIKPDAVSSVEQGDLKDPQPDHTPRFWRIKRVDPFGDPSVNVSDDRLKSRLKAELGRSAMTTLLDTRSHSTLLGDIGAGMMTSASYRRRATRAEAEEAFNRQLRPTRSRSWGSTASVASLKTVSNKGSESFGGFLSEEVSDMNFALPSSGDLKTLVFERDLFDQDTTSTDSRRTKGSGGDLRESRVDDDALRPRSTRRRRNKRQDAKARGMADPRKTICTLAGMNPLLPLPGKTVVETESFLAASTTIFPTTIDEAMVLEAKDMALKMRRIHDALQGEVAQKTKKLMEMKRKIEERASQDAYTMSRTTAGERVIKALETRLTKVRLTTAELERIGAFYVRIIDFCIKNPPKDNRHLKALEEQVFLSKQQTKDLSGKVWDLLLEKDAIKRLGIHSLKAQLTRREMVQQKVHARTEQLREQIQKNLKSERKGCHSREGGIVNSTPFNTRGTGNANQGSSSSMPSAGESALTTTNGTLREKQYPENRRRTSMQASTKEESLEEALEKLAILVGAEDIDDITTKLKTVQEREEHLNAQKQAAALAAERLHLELEGCQKQLSDLELRESSSAGGILVGGGTTNSNAALSTRSNENLHRKQRELDDLVLQSSIRLKQAKRKANKAKGTFNDLRVGIIHLATVIDSVVRRDDNAGTLIPLRRRVRRTLQANVEKEKFPFTHAAVRTVPATEGLAAYGETAGRVAPPEDVDSQFGSENEAVEHRGGSGLMDTFSIGQEEDVCKLLDACEERVRGVMELCGCKAGEELGTITTEAMAAYTRTTNEGFWHSGLSATTVPIDRQLITEGPGNPSILERLLMGRVKGFESDGTGMDIRTLPPKARDSRFERNMAEALRKQNEKLEVQEREVNNLDRKAVASFLEDALNSSKSANMHLRRANMLTMGKQGKRAGFGLVMDDVLSGAHINVNNLATKTSKTSKKEGCFLGRDDLSPTVLERPAIKASAQVLSSRRKQESRKRASLETKNQTGKSRVT